MCRQQSFQIGSHNSYIAEGSILRPAQKNSIARIVRCWPGLNSTGGVFNRVKILGQRDWPSWIYPENLDKQRWDSIDSICWVVRRGTRPWYSDRQYWPDTATLLPEQISIENVRSFNGSSYRYEWARTIEPAPSTPDHLLRWCRNQLYLKVETGSSTWAIRKAWPNWPKAETKYWHAWDVAVGIKRGLRRGAFEVEGNWTPVVWRTILFGVPGTLNRNFAWPSTCQHASVRPKSVDGLKVLSGYQPQDSCLNLH